MKSSPCTTMDASIFPQRSNTRLLTSDSNPTVFNVRVYSRSHAAAASRTWLVAAARPSPVASVLQTEVRQTTLTLHCTKCPFCTSMKLSFATNQQQTSGDRSSPLFVVNPPRLDRATTTHLHLTVSSSLFQSCFNDKFWIEETSIDNVDVNSSSCISSAPQLSSLSPSSPIVITGSSHTAPSVFTVCRQCLDHSLPALPSWTRVVVSTF